PAFRTMFSAPGIPGNGLFGRHTRGAVEAQPLRTRVRRFPARGPFILGPACHAPVTSNPYSLVGPQVDRSGHQVHIKRTRRVSNRARRRNRSLAVKRTMRPTMFAALFATVSLLGIAPMARAGDQRACSAASLRGSFGFTSTGTLFALP